MSEEEKQMFNKMIYCNLINGEQALKFNRKYEDLQQKVEQLEKENEKLQNYVDFYEDLTKQQIKKYNQLENIRKEAIEYILKNKLYRFKYDNEELFEITTDKKAKDDLLNILNKGSNKE